MKREGKKQGDDVRLSKWRHLQTNTHRVGGSQQAVPYFDISTCFPLLHPLSSWMQGPESLFSLVFTSSSLGLCAELAPFLLRFRYS